MEKTGMFIFEVGLLNGFSTSVEQTELINEKAKLVELEDGDVNIYFDQVWILIDLTNNLFQLIIGEQ